MQPVNPQNNPQNPQRQVPPNGQPQYYQQVPPNGQPQYYQQVPPKKKSVLPKILIGILVALGVIFLLIMLIPGDEEDSEGDRAEAAENTGSSGPDNNGTGGNGSGQNNSQGSASAGKTPVEAKALSVGTDAKSATIMVYVNGSDLESEAGEATTDFSEMIASGIGNNVNVIIQTMGTKEWQDYGISSKTAQTYKIENRDLKLIRDDLGQLDCTSKKTLSEFIGFCKDNYPAERYLFLFWDHGGGPVYGFGYDEWQKEGESLTIAEMSEAFAEHKDIRFDIIGMDCCIMASLETCYALAPYCKYALLSEDFESGLGWDYTAWMRTFEENPGISTPLLGKYIVDAIIADNESSPGGDSSCMGLFNVSTAKNLFSAWKAYAYRNEAALLKKNYSREHKAKGRGFWDLWGFDESDVTLSDYYISDVLALVESIDDSSAEAKSLMSALKAAVAYYGHTEDKNELTGLAVSLPYGDADFYRQLSDVYRRIGLDDEYIDWLGEFVSVDGYDDYYDFGGFEDSWGGWGAYEDEYGCNYSDGSSCEYGYDYGDDYWEDEDGYADDWIYDYEEDIWYLYDDDILYLYDEDTDTMFYYDEYDDEIYYYDEDEDDWFVVED
ncbi:MAG: hypothetical protein K6F53_09635 [Lachnospiraceae bacterium]|nr:hypothetical protein [Lachnospiraceae bacterium]